MLMAMGYSVAKFQVIESHTARYVGVLTTSAGWLVVAIAGLGFMRQRRAIDAAELAPAVFWNVGLALLTAGAAVAAVLSYLLRS